MGKYSIDAFEQYPLVKIRPKVTQAAASCYRLVSLSWAQLEPEDGQLLSPGAPGGGTVILQLNLDRPGDVADACGFVRRMGSFYQGGKDFAGVLLSAGNYTSAALGQLVQAYAQGFESTFLLAEPGTELMAACCKQQIKTGLWLDLNRGILNLRRAVAESNLQKTWREAPVYLYASEDLNGAELDAAVRWHASGVNLAAPVGPFMTLRRMMFPEGLTAGGLMPLRLWWQNIGTAPIYKAVEVKLELRSRDACYAISVPGVLEQPDIGDSTLNLTARLPKTACGSYSLWCGLKVGQQFLPLAMEATEDDGMYHVGDVTLDDQSRPYLETMWEEQYADGYYPLEDPAQPD